MSHPIPLGYDRYARAVHARLPSYGVTRLLLPAAATEGTITDALGHNSLMRSETTGLSYTFDPVLTAGCVVTTSSSQEPPWAYSSLDDQNPDALWPSVLSDVFSSDTERAAQATQVLTARRKNALGDILAVWPTLPTSKQSKLLRVLLGPQGERMTDEDRNQVLAKTASYLEQADAQEQEQAIDLLFEMRPPPAALLQGLTSHESLRALILPRLARTVERPAAFALLRNVPASPELRRALRAVRDIATDGELVTALSDSGPTWRAIALSEWTTRSTNPAMLAALHAAVQAPDPTFDTQWNLLTACAHAGRDEAIDQYLADLAAGDAPWMLRTKATQVLLERDPHASPRTLALLMREAEDSYPRVREHAVLALAKLSDTSAQRAVAGRARSDAWPRVRAAAFTGLISSSNERAIEIARFAMQDPSALVRAEALDALVEHRTSGVQPGATALMQEILADEHELPAVVARAIDYVEASCDTSAVPALQALIARAGRPGADATSHELGPRATAATTKLAQCSTPSATSTGTTP